MTTAVHTREGTNEIISSLSTVCAFFLLNKVKTRQHAGGFYPAGFACGTLSLSVIPDPRFPDPLYFISKQRT